MEHPPDSCPKGSVVVPVKELRETKTTYFVDGRHRVEAKASGNAEDMLTTRDFNEK